MKRKTKLPYNKVQNWLSGSDTYTLHKPIREKFLRRRVYVSDLDDQWQADVNDLSSISDDNDGFRYILTVIDCFSKYGWARAVKDKYSKTIAAAFKDILQTSNRKPRRLQTDKGKEFMGEFKKMLQTNKIEHFTTENEQMKAQICERFNRTLKESMWRYFTHKNNKRYLEVLPDLVKAYNSRYHRSIGMAPNKVNYDTKDEVAHKLYDSEVTQTIKPKYRIGDKVRISKARQFLAKSYLGNWSREIFEITSVKLTQPPVYHLKDYSDEAIKGTFYEPELQKVTAPKVYKIREILKERRRKGRIQYLVSWEGYPSSFNQWITKAQLRTYRG